MILTTEFHDALPRDKSSLIDYRISVLEECNEDEKARVHHFAACARDPLYFTQVFATTYDPRCEPSLIPFLLWDFQKEAFIRMFECQGDGSDLVIEKSRDLGASWLTCLFGVYYLLFRPNSSGLYVSRKADLVDAKGNTDSLFSKIDTIIQHLPGWLKPNMARKLMALNNVDNGAIVNGESTGSDTGRGGRRTYVVLDEFAAVEDGFAVLAATGAVTNTRLFVSTPKGEGNAFADVARNDHIPKLTFGWWLDPRKNDGLSKTAEGKWTSPWYELQCQRASNRIEIAQELDIDYSGSDYSYFDPDSISKYAREVCRNPDEVGELVYDHNLQPLGFSKGRSGRLSLWGIPREDTSYIIGVDIATGTGSSNSVMSVVDKKRLTKVACFVDANTRPDELARYAVALGRHFRGNQREAYIIYEANGPGRVFGDVIEEYGYSNIYFRQTESRPGKPPTKTPGWYATKESKQSLFGSYRAALHNRTFENPCRDAIEECRQIIFVTGSGIDHARGHRSPDPSGARENHADRPTADALAWRGVESSGGKKKVQTKQQQVILSGSFADRRRRRKESDRERNRDRLWR